MSHKFTDDEIQAMPTRKRWLLSIGYEHWALARKDAMTMIEIFDRSLKVEEAHTSDYRHSVWIAAEDQSPPFAGAQAVPVRAETAVEIDRFTSATRETSA